MNITVCSYPDLGVCACRDGHLLWPVDHRNPESINDRVTGIIGSKTVEPPHTQSGGIMPAVDGAIYPDIYLRIAVDSNRASPRKRNNDTPLKCGKGIHKINFPAKSS